MINVIGLGYFGQPTALMLASHRVVENVLREEEFRRRRRGWESRCW